MLRFWLSFNVKDVRNIPEAGAVATSILILKRYCVNFERDITI